MMALSPEILAGIQGDSNSRVAAIRELAIMVDPVRESRKYELLATQVATIPLPDIVTLATRIAQDAEEDNNVRVFSAVVGATACRRMRLQSQGRGIVRDVQHLEELFPILKHIRSLTYLDGRPSELRDGLNLAESAYVALPDNPGVSHALACFLVDSCPPGELQPKNRAQLKRALGLVNNALRDEFRSKFFHTRAKIQHKLGRHAEAKADLVTAIDNENRDSIDHVERVMSYVVESSLVDVSQVTADLARRAEEAIADTQLKVDMIRHDTDDALSRIRQAQARTVETVAFFAGALALVQFSAITLGKEYSVFEAILVISVLGIILFGSILGGAYLLRRGLKD